MQEKVFTFVPAVNIFICAVPKIYSFFPDFSDKNESNLSLALVYLSQVTSFSVKFLSKRGLFSEPVMYETICDCSTTFKGIGMFSEILCQHRGVTILFHYVRCCIFSCSYNPVCNQFLQKNSD